MRAGETPAVPREVALAKVPALVEPNNQLCRWEAFEPGWHGLDVRRCCRLVPQRQKLYIWSRILWKDLQWRSLHEVTLTRPDPGEVRVQRYLFCVWNDRGRENSYDVRRQSRAWSRWSLCLRTSRQYPLSKFLRNIQRTGPRSTLISRKESPDSGEHTKWRIGTWVERASCHRLWSLAWDNWLR